MLVTKAECRCDGPEVLIEVRRIAADHEGVSCHVGRLTSLCGTGKSGGGEDFGFESH